MKPIFKDNNLNLDYDKTKENFENLGFEIIAKSLNPDRIIRLINIYGENEIIKCYYN